MDRISGRTVPNFDLRLLLALVLAILAVACFWPATQYEFLNFDDTRYVSGNPHVSTGLSLENIRWAFTAVHENWWLPMLWISYMADSTLWGPAPFGYHLTNILLHAINTALLFWVLSAMTGARWRSAFVAALFALHPLRVESVVWIAERKDVLSGFFFLLALLAYLRHAERPAAVHLGLVFALMLLGLLSKAIVIVLPFLLLLLDYWPLRRVDALWGRKAGLRWGALLLEKIPLFGLTAIFIYINLHTLVLDTDGQAQVSLPIRLGLVFPNYWVYVRLVFWPMGLFLIYPENDVVHWPTSIAALAGLVALSLLCLRLRKRQPYLLVGWFWFLIGLLPIIRGVRLGLAAYAGRFTYLPAIGLSVAIIWAVADLTRQWRRRTALLAALAFALLAACVWQTRATLPLWGDYVTACQNVLAHLPDSPVVHNGLGAYYASIGETNQAVYHFQRSLAIKPDYSEPHLNLATLCLRAGNTPEAIAHYRAVLEFEPDRMKVLNNLAWFLATQPNTTPAQCEEALRHVRRAVELLKSPPASILDTLAAALAANGQFAEAQQTALQAIALARKGGDLPSAEAIEKRLAVYRQNQRWREQPTTP